MLKFGLHSAGTGQPLKHLTRTGTDLHYRRILTSSMRGWTRCGGCCSDAGECCWWTGQWPRGWDIGRGTTGLGSESTGFRAKAMFVFACLVGWFYSWDEGPRSRLVREIIWVVWSICKTSKGRCRVGIGHLGLELRRELWDTDVVPPELWRELEPGREGSASKK